MARPRIYNLSVKMDGLEVRGLNKPVTGREIPQELARLVYSAHKHDYEITVYRNGEPAAVLYKATAPLEAGSYRCVPGDVAPAIRQALSYAEQRLNSDLLYYVYKDELLRIAGDNPSKALFERCRSGSDYGYISPGKTVINVNHLSYGTVIKVYTHWTSRYRFVETWRPIDYAAMVSLCRSLRGGEDNAQEAVPAGT